MTITAGNLGDAQLIDLGFSKTLRKALFSNGGYRKKADIPDDCSMSLQELAQYVKREEDVDIPWHRATRGGRATYTLTSSDFPNMSFDEVTEILDRLKLNKNEFLKGNIIDKSVPIYDTHPTAYEIECSNSPLANCGFSKETQQKLADLTNTRETTLQDLSTYMKTQLRVPMTWEATVDSSIVHTIIRNSQVTQLFGKELDKFEIDKDALIQGRVEGSENTPKLIQNFIDKQEAAKSAPPPNPRDTFKAIITVKRFIEPQKLTTLPRLNVIEKIINNNREEGKSPKTTELAEAALNVLRNFCRHNELAENPSLGTISQRAYKIANPSERESWHEELMREPTSLRQRGE